MAGICLECRNPRAEAGAYYCHHCERRRRSDKRWALAGVLVVALVLLGGLLFQARAYGWDLDCFFIECRKAIP